MTAIEIKSELRKMIENETEINTRLNPIHKEKLTARALKSEEDIMKGRVFSKDEVIKHINHLN